MSQKYGWLPDDPDDRDILYVTPAELASMLPASVDLRSKCPAVYNQGALGSCTANAIAGAIEFEQIRQQMETPFTPSRLMIYYCERVIENTVATDSGAQLRDGIKSVVKKGASPEELWPYDPSEFAVEPDAAAWAAAKLDRVVLYRRIAHDLDLMRACLAEGCPFVFGFTAYTAFETEAVATSGHLNVPAATETVLGGHAVMAVGYDDANQWFWVRNSWGPDWGIAGYFTMPYAYIGSHQLARDFWTIRFVDAGAGGVAAAASGS